MKAIIRLFSIAIFVFLAMSIFAEDVLKHTLAKGETLYSISRKYNVSYEALAAANGITDPTKLRIGTVLIIPEVHVVAKGETLFGISKQYGISVSELLSANKLKSDYVLKIDDVLIIPGAKTKISSAVPPLTVPSTTTLPSPAPMAGAPSPISTTLAPAATSITTVAPAIAPAPAKTSTTSLPASGNGGKLSPSTSTSVPMPEPVKTQDKVVDMKLVWPVPGKAMYLDGKLEGIMIRAKPGEISKTIASGTVVSAGPSRGFSQVVFIQAKSGYVYVYGGNESLSVKTGEQVPSGKEIGKIGIDSKDGSPIAYFFVFRNGQPIDPALAPRD
ncbi:MAG: LysM peptidoglycan-binding domain-containing protein [Spirochaetales bacterium]